LIWGPRDRNLVRVLRWLGRFPLVPVPDGVSDAVASFVEPVNTCLKAVARADVQPHDTAWVVGAGLLIQFLTHLVKFVSKPKKK